MLPLLQHLLTFHSVNEFISIALNKHTQLLIKRGGGGGGVQIEISQSLAKRMSSASMQFSCVYEIECFKL